MLTNVTPEQRRRAKQEIVKAVRQGTSASAAREQSGIPNTPKYDLSLAQASTQWRRKRLRRWAARSCSQGA